MQRLDSTANGETGLESLRWAGIFDGWLNLCAAQFTDVRSPRTRCKVQMVMWILTMYVLNGRADITYADR